MSVSKVFVDPMRIDVAIRKRTLLAMREKGLPINADPHTPMWFDVTREELFNFLSGFTQPTVAAPTYTIMSKGELTGYSGEFPLLTEEAVQAVLAEAAAATTATMAQTPQAPPTTTRHAVSNANETSEAILDLTKKPKKSKKKCTGLESATFEHITAGVVHLPTIKAAAKAAVDIAARKIAAKNLQAAVKQARKSKPPPPPPPPVFTTLQPTPPTPPHEPPTAQEQQAMLQEQEAMQQEQHSMQQEQQVMQQEQQQHPMSQPEALMMPQLPTPPMQPLQPQELQQQQPQHYQRHEPQPAIQPGVELMQEQQTTEKLPTFSQEI